MQVFKSACPLDCWDECSFLVEVENNRIIAIKADPAQPVTGQAICAKGRKHLERNNHPNRLLFPLLKRRGSFKRIGWADTLEIMAEKISETITRHGPLAILPFSDGGYGGLLKNIEDRFFSALGGCTLHRGNLCWGAGLAAQRYDFGAVLSHDHDDLLNARLIVIWGRNPAATQVHLIPYIKKAKAKGARVILIDPLQTETAALADDYIRIKPASDGLLALAMAGVMIDKKLCDTAYIEGKTSGFAPFAEMCAGYSLEEAENLTGVPAAKIESLALEYAHIKPAAILIGIGLQRHSNGGNTVRAIDALAALSGNIGKAGGGANYANFRISRFIDHGFLSGADLKPQHRYYPKPQLAEALNRYSDPPVELLYISRSNPLVQVGNSNKLRRAFRKVPFIVTAEHFLTDTAAASDLVLPATTFFEAEDIFFTSMSHQYLSYGPRLCEPPGECRPEYAFMADLAAMLSLQGFPSAIEPENLLTRAIAPLTEKTGLTLEAIKEKGPLMPAGFDRIPWSDGKFATEDGRFNFFSLKSEKDGSGGLPHYYAPFEISDLSLKEQGYRYWLVSPHPHDSIHSTHRLPGGPTKPEAYLHPDTAAAESLVDGDRIEVASPRGKIDLIVSISERIAPETVMIYEGWWHESGAAVNLLTGDALTDMGNQAAYYDCLCRVKKVKYK